MFEKLPSLRGFQPQWFTGGSTTCFLPLLYDLVVLTRPRRVVTLGFGDGQIHFAFCQAAKEAGLTTPCIALRRDFAESEDADEGWVRGLESGKESYGAASTLISQSWTTYAASLAAGSIDLLLVDEIDSGAELADTLASYELALAPNGLVLFHGTSLQRSDSPDAAWEKWVAGRDSVSFHAGIGLSVVANGAPPGWLFPQERATSLGEIYGFAVDRISAQKRAVAAEREVASLHARQVWLDSILSERKEAQRIMDEQARIIAELQPRVEAWQRDRDSLQRDRANWASLAQHYEVERDKYKLQSREQKELLKIARKACRKKGKCFLLPHEIAERQERPISERILRELKRVPKNLLGGKAGAQTATAPPASRKKTKAATPWAIADPRERYTKWIEEHEPDKAGLDAQRRENREWPNAPTISGARISAAPASPMATPVTAESKPRCCK